jgi:hypothetical protein
MDYKKNLESFMTIDSVRFFKLMEISQYAILGLLFALYFGNNINSLFSEFDETKYTHVIIYEIILQVFLLVIITYYIKKFILIIPFILLPFINKYNINYISSKKNEALFGALLGIGLVFIITQNNLTSKILELSKKFSLYNSHIVKKIFNL